MSKILIVDDDNFVRNVYAEKFRAIDFEVLTAVDGAEALEEIRRASPKPDVVFTGIEMPKMDGFSLLLEMRKDSATKDVPVVISSHRGRKEDERRARQLGAVDFIFAGLVTPNEVVERIQAVLGGLPTYRVALNKGTHDAMRLAEDLDADPSLACRSCGNDLLLEITYVPQEKCYRLFFVCSACGQRAVGF
ncbi:response regulator [Candidatus Parcubacteria bacterium]|nr:response regulator [Candidatus Parcubacteria bacterium]MBI4098954.1 response regulator [Candidatus Parcubacteria bacterium]